MASDPILCGMVFSFAIGGGVLYSGFKSRKRARTMTDTPRSKLASAPQGFVEVEGFAWPRANNVVRSISKFDCVYYKFQLQRQESRGSGKNQRKVWVSVYESLHADPFYLCDPTGVALLDLANAEIVLNTNNEWNWQDLASDVKRKISEPLGDSISGFPPSEGFFGSLIASKFRVVESELRVGAPIYSTGDFKTLANPPEKIQEPGLTRFFQQVMDEKSRSAKDLTPLLDRNHDSKVSSVEARDGYANAASLARGKAAIEKPTERDFEIHGILQSTATRKLYVIDDHEVRLVSQLTWASRWKLASGVVALTVGFALGLSYFVPVETLLSFPGWKHSYSQDHASKRPR